MAVDGASTHLNVDGGAAHLGGVWCIIFAVEFLVT